MKKANLDSTLETILSLIQKDVEVVLSNFADKQLDSYTAATLCKYASTLSSIKSDIKKEETTDKKALNNMDTDALIKLYMDSKK